MSFNAPARAGAGHPVSRTGARRGATLAFAVQGLSVAAVYTTVPAVTEHLNLAPLLTTAVMVAVALSLAWLLMVASRPQDAVLGRVPGGVLVSGRGAEGVLGGHPDLLHD